MTEIPHRKRSGTEGRLFSHRQRPVLPQSLSDLVYRHEVGLVRFEGRLNELQQLRLQRQRRQTAKRRLQSDEADGVVLRTPALPLRPLRSGRRERDRQRSRRGLWRPDVREGLVRGVFAVSERHADGAKELADADFNAVLEVFQSGVVVSR